VDATIRTVSTFSFGSFIVDVEELDGVVELDVAELLPSIVPVISTLWPTCGVSFELSASSRYVLLCVIDPEVPVALVVDDDVVDDELEALVSRNADSLELVAPVVPLVPVAPGIALDPRSTQPVTVI
jgi:hypothetical protein